MFRYKLFTLFLAIFSLFSANAYAQTQKVKVSLTGPASMQPGSNVTYTVTTTNVTNTTLTGVWIYHHFGDLPEVPTLVTSLSTPGCVAVNDPSTPGWVICPQARNDTLAPYQSRSYTVTYKVPDSIPCSSSVVAYADVRANGTDPHWASVGIPVVCPVTPAVLPTLDCVYNLGNGVYRAYFGYNNTGSQSVAILAGTNTAYESNFLTPGPANRGQPVFFTPGVKKAAFFAEFTDSISWFIKPRFGELKIINATKNSKACFPIKPIAECRNLKPNNQYLTSFGYQNDNPFNITLPVSSLNQFSPGQQNRGQPELFLSGRITKAVTILAESGLTWTIAGQSAQSNNAVPQCVQDLGPICKVVGASNNNCGGSITNIALDASQSNDPEGAPLTYHWSSSCANSYFADGNTSKPTLTVNTNGQADTCNVTLVVNDGINNSTPCNFNINVNSCVYDCAGKLNGTATLDRCGVCEGNGRSCLDCNEINTSDSKFSLDIGAAAQKNLVKKIANRLQSASRGNVKYKPLIDASLKESDTLYRQAWVVAWTSFPNIISSCTNADLCTRTDYGAALDTYASTSKRQRAIAIKLLKQIAKLRSSSDIKGKNGDKKLTQQANDLNASNAALITTVPRFSSQCS